LDSIPIDDGGDWQDLRSTTETLLHQLEAIFTPGTPVAERDMLVGRRFEIDTLKRAIVRPGQHAIIYGERGVGKTSLAEVARDRRTAGFSGTAYARVSAHVGMHTDELWFGVFRELQKACQASMGFFQKRGIPLRPVAGPAIATPDEIRSALQDLGVPVVVMLDEVDRIGPGLTMSMLTDTVKALADTRADVTLVLIGVGESVQDLMHEHRSIVRSLEPIPVSRMSEDELIGILDRAKVIDVRFDRPESCHIVRASTGLPYLVHLLGRLAAINTIRNRRLFVNHDDVRVAVKIASANDLSRRDYYAATVSSRLPNLYASVLLASAISATDEDGWFATPSVKRVLSQLLRRDCAVQDFQSHLSALCGDGRGPVLKRRGTRRMYQYRFVNSELRAYVVLRHLALGEIDFADLPPIAPASLIVSGAWQSPSMQAIGVAA